MLLVLAGVTYRVVSRICFEGVPAQEGRDGAICRGVGMGPEEVARSKELVLAPTSVRLSRLEEQEEKWQLPSHFFPKNSPKDPCFSSTRSKSSQ